MKYPRGFIDPRRNVFYSNNIITGGRQKNAEEIITKRNWNIEWENDLTTCNEAPDFLVFRKAFIQLGCSNEKVIAISKKLYNSDITYSKVWRAIVKALELEQIETVIKEYKIVAMNEPKNYR